MASSLFKPGNKPLKSDVNKPLLRELNKKGYTIDNICKELEISKLSVYNYFANIDEFKLKHLKKISWLLGINLADVLNIGMRINEKCPQWVNNIVNVDNIIKTDSK
jgi:hypothetical protein